MAKLIYAKFAGTCPVCSKPFAEGERIVHDKSKARGQRSFHEQCWSDQRRAQQTADRSAERAQRAENERAALEYAAKATIRLHTFDSPAALANAAEGMASSSGTGGEWAGGSMANACRMARTGDDSLVADAERLVDLLRVSMPETTRPHYVPSPYGAYPIVPEALAGYPLSMRAKQRVTDDRAPVRVYVDLTVSGGCSHETIRARGISALSLVMMASERRPIELFTITALSGRAGVPGAVAVRINAQPLELATACHALTATSFFRRLGYDYLTAALDCGGGWALGILPEGAGRARYVASMRAALNLTETDLFIPPVWLTDQIVADAPTWLNERLAELGMMDATETA